MPAKPLILSCVALVFAALVGFAGYAFSEDVGFGLVAAALVTVIIAAVIWK
jgi:hypothetical protein